jgi:hypothetical protein
MLKEAVIGFSVSVGEMTRLGGLVVRSRWLESALSSGPANRSEWQFHSEKGIDCIEE